jgi:hypothetical protein
VRQQYPLLITSGRFVVSNIPVRTHVQTFGLEDANDGLIAGKHDAIKRAVVLVV